MSIIRWQDQNTFNDVQRRMQNMFENMDRLLSLTPSENLASTNALLPTTFLPRVDISQDSENLYLHMELPGLKQENVKLTISDGVLTVRGDKKRETTSEDREFTKIERSYGQFVRQFVLPTEIREDDVQATFADGVLEITIPRAEPAKPAEREVQIQSGNKPKLNQQVNEVKSANTHVSEHGKLSQNVAQDSSPTKATSQVAQRN